MSLPALLRTAALAAVLLPAAAPAATIGLVTIVDGSSPALLRDTQRFEAAEGLRLRADDILRSAETTALTRLELDDGSTLDLGPSTELLLRPSANLGQGQGQVQAYLLRGWLKVTVREGSAGIALPQGEPARVAGTAVLRVGPSGRLAFAESGSVEIAHQALREGDAFVQRAGEAGSVLRRMPAALMDGLPRAFADSLPRRAARFEKAPGEPGRGEELRYAEVAAWLNAEPPLRAAFVPRFAARARDREFRAGLVAELRAHPEWDRLLFPEKYRPKPVAVASRPPLAAASAAPVATPPALELHGLMRWPGAAPPADTTPPAERP